MDSIIEVKNISKKYNINQQRGKYIALRDVLSNIVKRPFKFAKNKAKQAIGKAGKEEFWALKDINFTVEKGEAIGIIGANGAGKSTLLKILTRITPPTTGEIRMKGKVASLLEVGTGFHPELTGRENIFLNGAILGMRKEEIENKFDEIVEFSGIGKFIDTPVKRYSSGMFVRLAFSVAAHLEPDILLVDEVLAVGDAEFQKKCLGKMDEVMNRYGRTILFVSHNMSAIQKLCKKCILLENGKIKKIDTSNEIINYYLNDKSINGIIDKYENKQTNHIKPINLISASLNHNAGQTCSEFGTTEDINISIKYKIKEEMPILFIDIYIYNEQQIKILHTTDNDMGLYCKKTRKPGIYTSKCKIPKKLLNTGIYNITLGARIPKIEQFFTERKALIFKIKDTGGATSIDAPRGGIVCPQLEWLTKKIN